MEFPSIKDLDIDIGSLEVPEGMAISIHPPTREYLVDPLWFDQVGRDPIDQRKIFDLTSRNELKEKISAVLEEWPRYGPAIYKKAALAGRVDVIELLISLDAECDPLRMKKQDGEKFDDLDVPGFIPEHGFLAAVFEGHFDVVKLFVDELGISVDYADSEDGPIALSYACMKRHKTILQWLLDRGATVTFDRPGDNGGDLLAAIKGGDPEIVEILLDNPQVVNAGVKIRTKDVLPAAWSGSLKMVRFVLQSQCFGIEDPDAGLAGQGEIKLSNEQSDKIEESLPQATVKGAIDSVKLLLKQLTSTRPDGSLQPFRLSSDSRQTQIFNATEDALETIDIPETFQILWDVVLHQPAQDPESLKNDIALPVQERLDRRLISACHEGRPKTVKLLIEEYGVDVNHISPKYFTTPLSRACSSEMPPSEERIQVTEYLLSRPDINIDLGVGEFCNGETALTLAVRQTHNARSKKWHTPRAKIVTLFLKHGGPVDEVDEELQKRCGEAGQGESDEMIEVFVLVDESKQVVKLSSRNDETCSLALLEYPARMLRHVLAGIKIRTRSAVLQSKDPAGRPLKPARDQEASHPALLAQETPPAVGSKRNIDQIGA